VFFFLSENFFRRATYILFPGIELVSCDTVKSFAARHGNIKSRESSFLAERAKNNQLLRLILTCEIPCIVLYSEFFLTLAIGFYMLIFQPPVNFCSDENIQTILGIKLEDFLNYRIDSNSISQTVEKVVKKIFLGRRNNSRYVERPPE
jgi:hypothetical protein